MKMSKTALQTWILVSHRAGARLLAMDRKTRHLVAVRDWEHPEGRLRTQDVATDKRSGRTEGVNSGQRRGDPEESPTEHIAEEFACKLARALDSARHQGEFRRLVLVAPPRFLGRLRSKLSAPTAATLVGTVRKDLPMAKPDELEALVERFLEDPVVPHRA